MPELYYFDRDQALIVMECLSPHVILRKSFIAGTELPGLGRETWEIFAAEFTALWRTERTGILYAASL